MRISECKMGEIVIEDHDITGTGNPRIGHIIGLTINATKEVIPVIRWATYGTNDGMVAPIHHANIHILGTT